MSELNVEKQAKKSRKRKTSDEQYELYLHEMEKDYAFRSGTINPTFADNYLSSRWESLVQKLNCTGNGPQLSVEDWKKRFRDWKNGTRAKYRKVVASRNLSGGGSPSAVRMTALEERGLDVWGRAAVTGFQDVEEVGLPPTNNPGSSSAVPPICAPTEEVDEVDEVDENVYIIEEGVPFSLTDASPSTSSLSKPARAGRPPSLHTLSKNLLDIASQNLESNAGLVGEMEAMANKIAGASEASYGKLSALKDEVAACKRELTCHNKLIAAQTAAIVAQTAATAAQTETYKEMETRKLQFEMKKLKLKHQSFQEYVCQSPMDHLEWKFYQCDSHHVFDR